MKVYAFEGPNEVYVCESLAHADGCFEAIDVENDEYVVGWDVGPLAPRIVLAPVGRRLRPAVAALDQRCVGTLQH